MNEKAVLDLLCTLYSWTFCVVVAKYVFRSSQFFCMLVDYGGLIENLNRKTGFRALLILLVGVNRVWTFAIIFETTTKYVETQERKRKI